MTKYKHGIYAAPHVRRRAGASTACVKLVARAQKFMDPVRRAAPRPSARRPGGGFGRLRVLAQCGTCRSQALGLKVRPQCGHCRESLVSKS